MRRFDKNLNVLKANILAEQRYLQSKGLIKEEEFDGDNFEDKIKDILGKDYPTFVKELGDNIKDKKFQNAIQSLANKAPISIKLMEPTAGDLRPTQSEIDVTSSLVYPLTKAKSAERILRGGVIAVLNSRIITAGGGKFIIDGHHRWAEVCLLNPEAKIAALDITNIKNPIEALKSTQLGIAGEIGKVPTQTVKGTDLLIIGEEELKNYVKNTITPEVVKVFNDIIGIEKLSSVLGIKDKKLGIKELIANYIWKNVQKFQNDNKPVSSAPPRDFMPQTDTAPGWNEKAPVPSSITKFVAENKSYNKRLLK